MNVGLIGILACSHATSFGQTEGVVDTLAANTGVVQRGSNKDILGGLQSQLGKLQSELNKLQKDSQTSQQDTMKTLNELATLIKASPSQTTKAIAVPATPATPSLATPMPATPAPAPAVTLAPEAAAPMTPLTDTSKCPAPPSKTGVVMGLVTGYQWYSMAMFVRTLRHSSYDGDIVLGTREQISPGPGFTLSHCLRSFLCFGKLAYI